MDASGTDISRSVYPLLSATVCVRVCVFSFDRLLAIGVCLGLKAPVSLRVLAGVI